MKKRNSDKQWNLFNKDIQKYIKENNLYLLGGTYYEMAEFLKNEGKNDSKLRNLGYKMKSRAINDNLKNYKNLDIDNLEIFATENSCPTCKKLNGNIISLNDVLSLSTLPVRNCSFPSGCRCVYVPRV